MASRDVNLERIKLEVKKEMLLSIEGMATSIKKPVKSSAYCQQKWRKGDELPPIDASRLMPARLMPTSLMPVPIDAREARLMPVPIDARLS